jgi:hypothetical protein
MKISLVDTEEQRKSNRLVQIWRDLEGQLGSEMTTENLLNKLPQDIKTHCAWGTVSDARCSASVENLGTEMESRLTSSNAESGEGRKLTGIVIGMMAELGNGLRFDNRPSSNNGTFRTRDG